jgi:hypothetical protein
MSICSLRNLTEGAAATLNTTVDELAPDGQLHGKL